MRGTSKIFQNIFLTFEYLPWIQEPHMNGDPPKWSYCTHPKEQSQKKVERSIQQFFRVIFLLMAEVAKNLPSKLEEI